MLDFYIFKENQRLRMHVHYVPEGSINVSSPSPRRTSSRVRKHPMDSLRFTYSDLRAELARQISAGQGPSAASEPNLNSALNAFLEERGIPDGDVIASTLRASYQKNVSAHLDSLRRAQRSNQYISNRKNLLSRWRQCLLAADRQSSARAGRETPFQTAIKELISRGSTVKGTARATGVPHCTLKRWLKGAAPNRKSFRWVPRLEHFFAVPAGTLVDLIPQGVHKAPRNQIETGSIAYRERLKKNIRLQYALKNPGPKLRAQWAGLVAFKTSVAKTARRSAPEARTTLERGRERGLRLVKQRTARWSTTTQPIEKHTANKWFAFQGDAYVASAAVNWSYVSQFLGWLALEEQHGGLGMQQEEAESLANLARDDLLEEYLEWRIARAGGIHHTGLTTLLTLVRGLCHPKTGYLTQSFEQFRQSGCATDPARWESDCNAAFDFAVAASADIDAILARSRDPFQAIGPALSLANPLDAVADAIARLDADRSITGGMQEAVWARDRLLFKLLASNPLRDKNVRMLTFREDGTGHLRCINGEWRIAIPKHEFKNAKGAAKDRAYDMPVRREVWGDIERYLRDYRPQLTSPSNPYVFVSSEKSDGPMYSLRRRFEMLTRAYLAGCPGVGPHAMRHIVATSILKQRPNDWAAAAWALHDKEETVKKHYVHLRSDDAERWLGPAMDGPFSRM